MNPFIPKVPLGHRWADIERARTKGRTKHKSSITVLGRNTRRSGKKNEGITQK